MSRDNLFSPRRVVVFPLDGLASTIDPTAVRERALAELRNLAVVGKDSRPPATELPYSSEKFALCLAMIELMTGHYHRPDLALDWAAALCFREALSAYSICSGFGLVHQFQRHSDRDIEVDRPPFDGWLFLFPHGVDWSDIDNQPVHCLLSGVSRNFGAAADLKKWLTLVKSIWKVAERLVAETKPTFDNPHLVNAARTLAHMDLETAAIMFDQDDATSAD